MALTVKEKKIQAYMLNDYARKHDDDTVAAYQVQLGDEAFARGEINAFSTQKLVEAQNKVSISQTIITMAQADLAAANKIIAALS